MKQNKLQNYLSVVSKLVIQVEICNRVSHDNMTILILAFSLKYNSRSFVPSNNTFRQSNYLMFWPQPMLMFNNFCWDIDRLPLFIFVQLNMRNCNVSNEKIDFNDLFSYSNISGQKRVSSELFYRTVSICLESHTFKQIKKHIVVY